MSNLVMKIIQFYSKVRNMTARPCRLLTCSFLPVMHKCLLLNKNIPVHTHLQYGSLDAVHAILSLFIRFALHSGPLKMLLKTKLTQTQGHHFSWFYFFFSVQKGMLYKF